MDNLPQGVEEAKRIKFENKQNALKEISTKNYGGFISNQQLNRDKFTATNKEKIITKKGPYEKDNINPWNNNFAWWVCS